MTESKHCFEWWSPTDLWRGLLVMVLIWASTGDILAAIPKWLRAAAQLPLPQYSENTGAVTLLNEQMTTVSERGEIRTVYRRAYRILGTRGSELGNVVVYFTDEQRLRYLKGWCVSLHGREYEVEDQDAVETIPFSGALYEDTRVRILRIPAAEPGSVIAYEYERLRKPQLVQEDWWFQSDSPVQLARFTLRLPEGWAFKPHWINFEARQPSLSADNEWVWQLDKIPPVRQEPLMPHWRAVAGRLAITCYPLQGSPEGPMSWQDVGLWYSKLSAESRQVTADITDVVDALVARESTLLEKVRALAAFVQREVRYVAIEIGTGRYRPSRAQDVLMNRYGDCKDKATLLCAMLGVIGVECYYVLLNTNRGVVAPDLPSMTNFNHVIVAIRLPEEEISEALYSIHKHERLGTLAFFDPTHTKTRFGYLSPNEQASSALLVTEEGGELVLLPLLPASANRLSRSASLQLDTDFTLTGSVHEVRWGASAAHWRSLLTASDTEGQVKSLESFLGDSLGNFRLIAASVENLEELEGNLVIHYQFMANRYAQPAGSLLIFRPSVLSYGQFDLRKGGERVHPVEFPTKSLQSDVFDIELPDGYTVDELPPPCQMDYPFARYQSSVSLNERTLRYMRLFEIKDILVSVDQQDDLRSFFRQVASHERTSVILKRSGPP